MKAVRDSSIDDLIVLARRGDLSQADRQRLDEALASSPEARLLHDAGRAFDMEGPVVAGDDERVAEIERAVRRGRRPRGWWGRSLRAAPALFAAVLAAGVAVGAVELSRGFVHPAAPVVATEVPAAPVSSATAAVPSRAGFRSEAPQPGPSTADAPPVVTAPTAAPASGPASPAPPVPAPVASTAPVGRRLAPTEATAAPKPPVDEGTVDIPSAPPEGVGPAPTAQQLFSQANVARVHGEPEAAMSLLRQLERQYPSSSEAAAAHLSLGMLLLQGGQAGAALDELRWYRLGAAGAMVPEALWGESQALHDLGRSAEERSVLEELLRGYPSSAYAGAAAKRLADLP